MAKKQTKKAEDPIYYGSSVITCDLGGSGTLKDIFKAVEAELARDGVSQVSITIKK